LVDHNGLGTCCRNNRNTQIAPINLWGPIQSGLVLFTVLMHGLALGVIWIFVPNVQEKAFRLVITIQWAVGPLLMLAFLFVPEYDVPSQDFRLDTGTF
jgi:hypothetical protein